MKKLILITVLCLFTLQCEQGWLKDILVPPVEGCTDSSSCNYNSDAEEDDGNCIAKQGCNGWCEGDSFEVGYLDNCGTCDADVSNDCVQDCNGAWGGDAELDCTGICEGGTVVDCAGVCGGSAVEDECGVCGGDGVCDEDDNNQTDCSDPNTCSNCTGCEASCCPNYCSGNYYYYNRSCSNGFCVGATSDYCSDGCNDDGCIESTYGCTNPSACNFDATATIFDDSCWFATEGCACSDGEGSVADCAGQCGGSADLDGSGICCFSGAVDVNGCCAEDVGNSCVQGCDGIYHSDGTHLEFDECDVCGGDGSSCNDYTVSLEIQNVNLDNGTLDIYMVNSEEVSGFQFELIGATITSATAPDGFIIFISISNSTILGYSLTETSIPIGEGVLTQVSFTDFEGNDICFGEDTGSAGNTVISDANLNYIAADWGECYEIP